MTIHSFHFAVTALALALAAPLAAQDSKPVASGKFEGRDRTFEAFGAYAFPAEVGMDNEPGVKVGVSNGGFTTERLDRIWDREHVIDEFFSDEETLVVYFHFAKDGKYKGMTYYFGSGDGCGFCYNGAVESTVKIEKGRIHGKVQQKPEPGEATWDIAFDVPVAPSDYGTPLPAGFGEPGKVYAAYHDVLAAQSNAEALRPFLDEGDAAELTKAAGEVMMAKREIHPTQSYRITKGWVNGDWALLLVEGETSSMKVETEAHLQKIGGTWRVYNEILQLKLGDG